MLNIKNTLLWLGRLVIMLSLIIVPFSMSHATMGSGNSVVHKSHAMTTHSKMANIDHSDHQAMQLNEKNSMDGKAHNHHDNNNCCSSICGGALTYEFDQTFCQTTLILKSVRNKQSIAPGEWVTPHRPPSI